MLDTAYVLLADDADETDMRAAQVGHPVTARAELDAWLGEGGALAAVVDVGDPQPGDAQVISLLDRFGSD